MSGSCKRNLLFVVGMLLVGMLFWIRYVLPKQSPLADTVTLTFVCYTNIDNYGLRTDYAAAVFRLANRSSHPIAYRQVFLETCHDGFWKREEVGQSFHTIVESGDVILVRARCPCPETKWRTSFSVVAMRHKERIQVSAESLANRVADYMPGVSSQTLPWNRPRKEHLLTSDILHRREPDPIFR